MSDALTRSLLERLLNVFQTSLPSYMNFAAPWSGSRDAELATLVRELCVDHRRRAEEFCERVLESGGSVQSPQFDLALANIHDLSLTYLLPQIERALATDIATLEQIAKDAERDSEIWHLTQQAIGSQKAFLDRLHSQTSG